MTSRQYKFQSYALLIVRLTLGYTFILHGGQKVLGLFGGPGMAGFVSWAGTVGIPAWLAQLGAFAEFLGGICLFFGIAAELGAIATIGVMKAAVFAIHWKNGFFVQNDGFEYPLNLIFFALAIIIGGPGAHALWDPFKKWRK
jgi:putative oxidoreductase